MKLHNYKTILLSFTILVIFTLAGCGDSGTGKEVSDEPGEIESGMEYEGSETAKAVNAFLEQNGWEKIKGGSTEEINSQFFDVLQKHKLDDRASYEEQSRQKMQIAEFIVETEYYGISKELFASLDPFSRDLLILMAVKTDAIPDKNIEATEFLELFYQNIKDEKYKRNFEYYFSYILFCEAAPEIIEKINNEWEWSSDSLINSIWKSQEAIVRALIQTSPEFKKAATEHLTMQDVFNNPQFYDSVREVIVVGDPLREALLLTAIQISPEFRKTFAEYLIMQDAFHLWEAMVLAAIQTSPEFRETLADPEFIKALAERLTIQKTFPLSIAEHLFANFKPSDPQKGKYLLVFDDKEHKLYRTESESSDYFTKAVSEMDISRYETGILQPATSLNEAKYIIYETYSYDWADEYNADIYFRHTNVKVVNLVTGKTIFNKTFESRATQEMIFYMGDYYIDDSYYGQYTEQILEIIKKGM